MNPLSVTYNQLRWISIGPNAAACPVNASPNWQNTQTPIRCQKNSNDEYTGWQEQEQRDINPNSNSFGEFRWVAVSQDYLVCTPPLPMMTVNGNNYSGEEGWRVTFTNTATQEVFDFELPPPVRGPIGSIRKGPYNVRIYNVNGNTAIKYFYIGGTSSLTLNAVEGNFSIVLFMNSQNWNDHIDVF